MTLVSFRAEKKIQSYISINQCLANFPREIFKDGHSKSSVLEAEKYTDKVMLIFCTTNSVETPSFVNSGFFVI